MFSYTFFCYSFVGKATFRRTLYTSAYEPGWLGRIQNQENDLSASFHHRSLVGANLQLILAQWLKLRRFGSVVVFSVLGKQPLFCQFRFVLDFSAFSRLSFVMSVISTHDRFESYKPMVIGQWMRQRRILFYLNQIFSRYCRKMARWCQNQILSTALRK